MKKTSIILLSLLTLAIVGYFYAKKNLSLGKCSMAPKDRPISCYEGQILDEDIPELKDLLENFNGNDNIFNLYLQELL